VGMLREHPSAWLSSFIWFCNSYRLVGSFQCVLPLTLSRCVFAWSEVPRL
jgi:hypothetical protein